jgi:RNA polymerase sigma-70 factor (sigma-E family)
MHSPDERGYVEYVTARMPALHRTAYLMCGTADLADDVVQSTLTTLFQHWPRICRADNVDAYVHRMLVRKLIDTKRLKWTSVLLMRFTPERPAPAPADQPEERDAVMRALATLPRGQRTVIVLRYLCDLSVEETAAALGCSLGNVKSQAARGLVTLRPLLAELAHATEHRWSTR